MSELPRVVVTRRDEQAGQLSELLRAAGFTPICFPTIQLQPLPAEELEPALADLGRFAWVIFSSGNAVDFFFARAGEWGRAGSKPKVAAVGPATARRLKRYQVEADFIPQSYTGESMAAGLGELAGKEVLLPRARLGRPQIVADLQERGALVSDIALYDTVTAVPTQEALHTLADGYEVITFASPSSVHGFLEIAGSIVPQAIVVCIGPVTAAEARQMGLTVTIVPDEYTAAGLVDSLVGYFGEER